MSLTRMTLFFQQTTAPTSGASTPRTGGWSESLWIGAIPFNPFLTTQWLYYRAMLLPPQCAIVGARGQLFQIAGNKLFPLQSAVYRGLVTGSNGNACDIPQIGIQIGGNVTGGVNAARFVLRGVPDSMIVNGEFTPNPNYAGLMRQYLQYLVTGVPFGMVGRDLTQVPQRITGVAGTQLTTSAPLGGVTNGQTFVRFVHARDDTGFAIRGSYLVTAGAGTATLTLQGLNRTLTKPNGLARVDAIAYYPFSALNSVRCVVRKTGRPFVQYRGRASKKH